MNLTLDEFGISHVWQSYHNYLNRVFKLEFHDLSRNLDLWDIEFLLSSYLEPFSRSHGSRLAQITVYLQKWSNGLTIADLCFDCSWLRKACRVVSSGIAASPSRIICLEVQTFSRWTLVRARLPAIFI